MEFYLLCPRVCAIHIDVRTEYKDGIFFDINSCNKETIIDIPYIRLIYTSGRLLRDNCVGTEQNDNEKQRDFNLHTTNEGTPEN